MSYYIISYYIYILYTYSINYSKLLTVERPQESLMDEDLVAWIGLNKDRWLHRRSGGINEWYMVAQKNG